MTKHSLTVLVVVLVLGGGDRHSVLAQTTSIVPALKDAYVDSMDPDTNFGPDQLFRVGRGQPLGLGIFRTLIEFDIPALQHTNLRRATLSAFHHGGQGFTHTAELHRCTETWDESTATWNLQPTFSNTVEAATAFGPPWGQWRHWDVTDLVLDIDAGAVANLGWLLKDQFETAGTSGIAAFRSREYLADPTLRPYLAIEYYDLLMTLPSLVVGDNQLLVSGTEPGEVVSLAVSLVGFGSSALPSGVMTDLDSPSLVASVVADGTGLATFDIPIAEPSAGVTFFVQALTLDKLSNPGQSLVTPLPCEGKLQAGSQYSQLGTALDVDAEVLVVGAPREQQLGAAYVYGRNNAGTTASIRDDGWVLEDEIDPPQPEASTDFGHSVAVDGKTLVIGAPLTNGSTYDVGAVYVYRRDGTGTREAGPGAWQLADVLLPPEPQAGMNFGWSVAVCREHVIVGAPLADGQTGRAFVYERDELGTPEPDDDVWPLVAELLPDDDLIPRFGWDVELAGDRAFVGAPRDNGGAGNYSGAVYVFRRREDQWIQQVKLKEPEAGAQHRFGHSVSADGGRLLVGTPYVGRAYVFRLQAGPADSWDFEAKLSDPGAFSQYGESVALSGKFAIVGARLQGPKGAAWVYGRFDQGTQRPEDDTWRVLAMLTPGVGLPYPQTAYGTAVGMAGDLVAVGEPGADSVSSLHRDDKATTRDLLDDEWLYDACLSAPEEPSGR